MATAAAAGGEGGAHTYRWPRPALTVDAAIVSFGGGGSGDDSEPPALLLIQRKHPPCKGAWALPGGFVDEGEPLDAAAARELREETGLEPGPDVPFVQVGAFGDPGRDPRGWTVTVAYAALVPHDARKRVAAADDAADARFFPVNDLPPLAFDHKLVVREALRRLAALPRAGGAGGGALRAAAERLEGPWAPPKE
ncbi:nudix hydrolase [Raphidocelis subcapitata]|uniref:Nudix hydrolase n=1 Tax=Raphidocelis subcapitata TaxID=307507 RepID=A0A2V0PAM0_9CHLO|nr:nudix hydrolase [Raphidocelis subcapitata]|eukprot:GBF96904.1 nudix hydrolase [Raphidocelis subcapitata]